MNFTDLLVAEGIPFDMAIYKDRNHGIYGGNARNHLYKRIITFLEQNLLASAILLPTTLRLKAPPLSLRAITYMMQEEPITQKKTGNVVRVRKPEWLKIRLGDNSTFTDTKHTIEHHGLNTICHSGRCPNQGECWSAGTATFMIGGAVCTRACRFCNTLSGKAPAPLDPLEPMKVAQSIKKMGLKHAVITSVDRDDLKDYGAGHWVRTIEAIRRTNT